MGVRTLLTLTILSVSGCVCCPGITTIGPQPPNIIPPAPPIIPFMRMMVEAPVTVPIAAANQINRQVALASRPAPLPQPFVQQPLIQQQPFAQQTFVQQPFVQQSPVFGVQPPTQYQTPTQPRTAGGLVQSWWKRRFGSMQNNGRLRERFLNFGRQRTAQQQYQTATQYQSAAPSYLVVPQHQTSHVEVPYHGGVFVEGPYVEGQYVEQSYIQEADVSNSRKPAANEGQRSENSPFSQISLPRQQDSDEHTPIQPPPLNYAVEYQPFQNGTDCLEPDCAAPLNHYYISEEHSWPVGQGQASEYSYHQHPVPCPCTQNQTLQAGNHPPSAVPPENTAGRRPADLGSVPKQTESPMPRNAAEKPSPAEEPEEDTRPQTTEDYEANHNLPQHSIYRQSERDFYEPTDRTTVSNAALAIRQTAAEFNRVPAAVERLDPRRYQISQAATQGGFGIQRTSLRIPAAPQVSKTVVVPSAPFPNQTNSQNFAPQIPVQQTVSQVVPVQQTANGFPLQPVPQGIPLRSPVRYFPIATAPPAYPIQRTSQVSEVGNQVERMTTVPSTGTLPLPDFSQTHFLPPPTNGPHLPPSVNKTMLVVPAVTPAQLQPRTKAIEIPLQRIAIEPDSVIIRQLEKQVGAQ